MADTTTITFKDSIFYKEIQNLLRDKIVSSSNNKIEIKTSDLQKVTSLQMPNLYIKDLTGIENFSYLTEINFSNNGLNNLTPLSNLTNLKKLEIYGNTFTSISPLKNLINLEYLDISRSLISDQNTNENTSILLDLQNMSKLNYLDVSHCTIIYINGIQNLTSLTYLNLYDNLISNFSYLSLLSNVIELRLGMNKPSFTGLDSLKKLTM